MISDSVVKARVRAKAWYEENREKANERARRYHAAHKAECVQRNREWVKANPEARLLASARHRAKCRGIPFDLVIADISIPLLCPVLGIPLSKVGEKPGDSSPSLDRIDNSKGYVRGNVVVVSWRANRLKSDGSPSELARIAEFYRIE